MMYVLSLLSHPSSFSRLLPFFAFLHSPPSSGPALAHSLLVCIFVQTPLSSFGKCPGEFSNMLVTVRVANRFHHRLLPSSCDLSICRPPLPHSFFFSLSLFLTPSFPPLCPSVSTRVNKRHIPNCHVSPYLLTHCN